MTNDQLVVDVLRAAGHGDAADLASKLMARPEPERAEKDAAPPASAALSPAEAEREAEGSALLDAMKRDLPDKFAA